MGQYYTPCAIIDDKVIEGLHSHRYGIGSKLMEHSWLKNDFVKTVESLIIKGGRWFGKPLIWAGDYADSGIYDKAQEIKVKASKKHYRYLLNHTKKVYIDKNKIEADKKGWKIHPLPLLTSEGNGQGGGDYKGTEMEAIGTWRGDIIEASNKLRKDYTEEEYNFCE